MEKMTLDRQEAAELLGVSRRTIETALKAGQLPTVRIGKRDLILREPLVRTLTEGEEA